MFAFDSSLRDSWHKNDNVWSCTMPDGWMQGRSVFGGLTVAKMAALCIKESDSKSLLRSFQAQLMNPVLPGEVTAARRILRTGKSTEFVELELYQQKNCVARAQFIFAKARKNSLAVSHKGLEQTINAEELTELPHIPGVIPEFVKNVDMRWSEGGPPFTGASKAQYWGVCRYRGPAGDVEGLVGLLDLWPCPTLSMLKEPRFASTVTWSAHVIEVPGSFEGWFTFYYETVAGRDGFHTVLGHLYGPQGRYLAMTEQLVVVFD